MAFAFIWFICGLVAVIAGGFLFLEHAGKITIGEVPQGLLILVLGPISIIFLIAGMLGHLYDKYQDHVIIEMVKKEKEESE
jgi:hypothetical protein